MIIPMPIQLAIMTSEFPVAVISYDPSFPRLKPKSKAWIFKPETASAKHAIAIESSNTKRNISFLDILTIIITSKFSYKK
jgi:hypothetical protein